MYIWELKIKGFELTMSNVINFSENTSNGTKKFDTNYFHWWELKLMLILPNRCSLSCSITSSSHVKQARVKKKLRPYLIRLPLKTRLIVEFWNLYSKVDASGNLSRPI